MKCPYCGKEMTAGKIKGDGRRKVKFCVYNDQNNFNDNDMTVRNILKVGNSGFPLFDFELDVYACCDCNKIIIDNALY